jgi:transcriptional regulator of aroF, aroG, tyrA and aromatic amino acid transport
MRLEINCQDRLGITQDVLDILTEYHIDLRGIEIDEVGKIFLDFPTIEF